MMTSEAEFCRDSFAAAILAELGEKSRLQLVNSIARATGLSDRRVQEIASGRVSRVWADEFAKIKEWHASWLDRQEDRLNHKMEHLRLSRSSRRLAS
jgi:hypothetical protein